MHRAAIELEGTPSSVPAARHFVSAALEAADAEDEVWTAVQIVSELATNAVVHAATSFVVTVTVDDGLIRLSVTDQRPFAAATKRRFSDETTTGRGLRLVETLSQSWGVEADATSKTVWCELVRAASEGDDDPAAAHGADPVGFAGDYGIGPTGSSSAGVAQLSSTRRTARAAVVRCAA